MTINSLMAQRTPFIYALPMSQMKEDFIAGKQAGATLNVDPSNAQRRAVERIRPVGRQVPGTGNADTETRSRTSQVRQGESASRRDAAVQGAASQSGSLSLWMRENAQAAAFSPSQRVTEIQTPAQRRALVEQLRADTERQMGTLKDLSSKIFTTQVNGYAAARNFETWDQDWKGFGDSIYHIGAQTLEEARRSISNGGYWGVEQTSDRLVKYATALAGGDPDKLDSMIEAFEKGYQQAEKAWGGTLPGIAQKTRETTLQKFQDLKSAAQDARSAAAVRDVQDAAFRQMESAAVRTAKTAPAAQTAKDAPAVQAAKGVPTAPRTDSAPIQASDAASVQTAKNAPVIQAVGAVS